MGVEFLGDADESMLKNNRSKLSDLEYKRAHHVITENRRVKDTAIAMQNKDAVTIGKLMNSSHESLRYRFEVTSPALNTIVSCSQSEPACYGARMTGAGFGGIESAYCRQS